MGIRSFRDSRQFFPAWARIQQQTQAPEGAPRNGHKKGYPSPEGKRLGLGLCLGTEQVCARLPCIHRR